jgi:hypothetical protein
MNAGELSAPGRSVSHPASLTRPDARGRRPVPRASAAIFSVTEALDRAGTAYRDGGWPALPCRVGRREAAGGTVSDHSPCSPRNWPAGP